MSAYSHRNNAQLLYLGRGYVYTSCFLVCYRGFLQHLDNGELEQHRFATTGRSYRT